MLSDGVLDGVGRPDGVDVLGPAGCAIVTNASNIHAGTVRGGTTRPRRSIILWWTHGPQRYPPYSPQHPDPAIQVHGAPPAPQRCSCLCPLPVPPVRR
eukprot:SAG11_NODE_86_length_17300_cov_11.466717_3_plen_98_part_00